VLLEEGKTVLTVSETGYGRRSLPSDYRLQSRGGIGTINYHTKKYGKVAAIAMVDEDEDLILIASDGIIIRIPAGSISTFARPSKGVRVMRVNEGERLATMVVVAHEDADKDDDETGDGSDASDASAETAETAAPAEETEI
jgi:DNA gyrase subunit A